MKILFSPCHYIYDEAGGGSEPSWAFNIADRISKTMNGSFVVTGFKNLLSEKSYQIVELQPGKKVIDLSPGNALVFMMKYFFKTQSLLKEKSFDILHHVLPFSIENTFDLSFIFGAKIPSVIGPIQSPLEYKDLDLSLSDVRSDKKRFDDMRRYFFAVAHFLISPALKCLSNITLRKGKVVVVIDEWTKNILMRNGIDPGKIVVIPPGIDTGKFEYSPFGLKDKKTTELLVVCYLVKRKGVDLIIRSIKDVVKKNGNIVLRIVGDGPQRKQLESLVRELDLQDYVIFEGFVRNSEIRDYYKRAHIFLSMSRGESWGQMYLEAMASGLPIITSKNRGSLDIVKDGRFGYLIEQEDCVGLSQKILILTQDANLISKFGENARIEAEKQYDWDDCIIPKYMNLYNKILSTGK